MNQPAFHPPLLFLLGWLLAPDVLAEPLKPIFDTSQSEVAVIEGVVGLGSA
jgi:hypothetical protein